MLKGLQAAYHSFLAAGCLHNERFDEAVDHLSRVIRLNPSSPTAYVNRGCALQGMTNYRGSIDDFNKALDIDPHLGMAYFNRGISWKILGDFDRAIADQSRATSLLPRFADAHAELGVAYNCRLDFDRAVDNLSTAIALAPNAPSHLKERGIALFNRGDFAAAAADLEKAFDLGRDAYALLFAYITRTKSGGDARFELAQRAERLTTRKWPAAIIELYLGRSTRDEALAAAANPEQLAEAQFYLGEWRLLHNDIAEARTAFETARRLCPPFFVESMAASAELRRLDSNAR